MITCWIHSWTNMQTQQTRLCYFIPFVALIFGQHNECLLFIFGLCKKHNKDLEIRPKNWACSVVGWNGELTFTFPSKRYQRALIICVSWATEENTIHAYSVCSCPLICEQRRSRSQQGRLNIPFIPFSKSRWYPIQLNQCNWLWYSETMLKEFDRCGRTSEQSGRMA